MSPGVRASGSRCLLGADRHPDGVGVMDHFVGWTTATEAAALGVQAQLEQWVLSLGLGSKGRSSRHRDAGGLPRHSPRPVTSGDDPERALDRG